MNEKLLLISIWTHAGSFVIFGTIYVRAVIEGTISLSNRSAPSLVHKMPVKTRKRPMLRTFVLKKERTLLGAKFFQVSEAKKHVDQQ